MALNTQKKRSSNEVRRAGEMSRAPSSASDAKILYPALEDLDDASRLPRNTADNPFAGVPIICVCHLSWDWVWQRPQQFLSRFAKTHPVLFIETHRDNNTRRAFYRLRHPAEYLLLVVAEIHLPSNDDSELTDREWRKAVQSLCSAELAHRFDNAVLWFYDPMAVTALAGHLNEQLIVYDCMDELSQFKGAPPALVLKEKQLLSVADVVFCGGRKMREKRLPFNSNTHFFGTGVDCAHFGRALTDQLDVSPDIKKLGGPVLGYFGVVDERIDYELIAKLADRRSDWQIAIVGPVTKVDPASFPQRPNLHWLGGKPYSDLPAIVKGFSVCLMPFARNASTEYINPTKALEYMAAGKPVVSTDLTEVRSNFGAVAQIGTNHEEFIERCEREVFEPSKSRVERGMKLAAENTWEAIVAKMSTHIKDALRAKAQPQPRRSLKDASFITSSSSANV